MERKRTKLQEQTAEYLSKYPHLQSSPNVTARPGKPSLQRSLKASNNPNAAAERKSKSKIPISTSGIFKKPIQPPAALKTKLNPPKRIQAPTSTSGTSSSTSKPRVTIVSPNKISKPQRKEHVLSRNFKEATHSYLISLRTQTQDALIQIHDSLLSHPSLQPTSLTPQQKRLDDRLRTLYEPIHTYPILVRNPAKNTTRTTTLEAEMGALATELAAEGKLLKELEEERKGVCAQISLVAKSILNPGGEVETGELYQAEPETVALASELRDLEREFGAQVEGLEREVAEWAGSMDEGVKAMVRDEERARKESKRRMIRAIEGEG